MKAFVEDLLPRYEYVSPLGEGKVSGTCKVLDKTLKGVPPKELCVKLIFIEGISDANLKIMTNTYQRLQEISCPYLIKVISSFHNESKTHFAIVSEFMQGGSLAAEITKVSYEKRVLLEEDIWSYIIQLCNSLITLHKAGIIHKAVKSSNIFLSEDKKTLKIGDLGIRHLLEQKNSSHESIPYSQSPEGFGGKFCFESDIWSLGCVIFEMMAQRPPFISRDIEDLQRKVENGTIQKVENISRNLQLLVEKILVHKPQSRPDLKSLMKYASSAQFKGSFALQKMLSPKANKKVISTNSQGFSITSFTNESVFLPKIDQNITQMSTSTNHNDSSFNADFPDKSIKYPFHPQARKNKKPHLMLSTSTQKLFIEDSNLQEEKSNLQEGKINFNESLSSKGSLQMLLTSLPSEKNQISQYSPKPLSISKKYFSLQKHKPSESIKESFYALDRVRELQEPKKKNLNTNNLGTQIAMMKKYGTLAQIQTQFDRSLQEQRHIVFMTDVARVVKMKSSQLFPRSNIS